MAQVDARQFTAIEHRRHVSHLTGVQIAHTLDGFNIHAKEPRIGGRRTGISKRGVKDHLVHIYIVIIIEPTRIVCACVQVVGCARATVALFVVVERERSLIIDGISLRTFGEVTPLAGFTIDAGLGFVCWVINIRRALTAHQIGTV